MRKHITAFLVTGILFGLAIGWLTNVGVGVFFGVLYGFVLTLVVHWFTRRTRFSGRVFLALLGIMSIACALVGALASGAVFLLPWGGWHPIPDSPEKAVEIIGSSDFNFFGGIIYVRTETGNIYSYECWEEQACDRWRREDSIPAQAVPGEGNGLYPSGMEPFHFLPPLAPGKVISSHVVNVRGPDYMIQINYILLEDGSLRAWSRFLSVFEPIFWPVPAIVAILIGWIRIFVLLIKSLRVIKMAGGLPIWA